MLDQIARVTNGNGSNEPPTAERIADLAHKAMGSCQGAAAELRELGEEVANFAAHVQAQCNEAADDFEKVGGQLTEGVNDFAKRALQAGTKARAARSIFYPANGGA